MIRQLFMLLLAALLLPAPARCGDAGTITTVTGVRELLSAVRQARPGATILLRDGVYRLDGRMLSLDVPGVTIRSASGNRERVVLDGGGSSPSVMELSASGVTVADLCITSPRNHAIHIFTPRSGGDIRGIQIRNVHIVDPGQQGIKVNPTTVGGSLVDGIIENSLIELTDSGRSRVRDNCYTGGIDAHHARNWGVRNNQIRGFWCPRGLSEHAIHFWKGSEGTTVEGNSLMDNARGIGFGMQAGRADTDRGGCPSQTDHRGGLIRDNRIVTQDLALFSSHSGADCGICLWYACGARVERNRIISSQPSRTFSSIEWRFPATRVEVIGNITNVRMLPRDSATALSSNNIIDPRLPLDDIRTTDVPR